MPRSTCIEYEHALEEAQKERKTHNEEARLKEAFRSRPSVEAVIACVAKEYGVTKQSIRQSRKGRQHVNPPRKVAMYLCQQAGDLPLQAIAEAFHVNHVGSVSRAIHDVKTILNEKPPRELRRMFKYFNTRQ